MQNVFQSKMGFPINLWTHHHQSFYRQQLNAAARYYQPDTTRYHQPEDPRYSTQMQQPGVTNQREPSIQGLQQREAGVFYHFTFRPKLLSSRGWTAVIKIRAAQSRSIFSFPPPRSCHKAQNLRPHVDMLANSKADPSLENEPVCLGS